MAAETPAVEDVSASAAGAGAAASTDAGAGAGTGTAPAPSSSAGGTAVATVASEEGDVRLELPFFVQTTELNCGPTALRMALAHLDGASDWDLPAIETAVGIRDGKAVSTLRLAIAVARLGFESQFFSTSLFFNEEHLRDPYYQRYGDMDLETSKALVDEARAAGVGLSETSLTLAQLLDLMGDGWLLVALLDMNVVEDREAEGYCGHFVPVVGYSAARDAVIVHNQASARPCRYLRIPAATFDRARRATGTDEDIVRIRKKPAAGASAL